MNYDWDEDRENPWTIYIPIDGLKYEKIYLFPMPLKYLNSAQPGTFLTNMSLESFMETLEEYEDSIQDVDLSITDIGYGKARYYKDLFKMLVNFNSEKFPLLKKMRIMNCSMTGLTCNFFELHFKLFIRNFFIL